MSLESTEKLLIEWGKWAKRVTIKERYMSPMTALYIRNIEQEREPEPNISDEVAEMIDRAVSRLKIREEALQDIILDYYRFSRSVRHIMRTRGMSQLQVNEAINRGIGWVDAYLDACTVDTATH